MAARVNEGTMTSPGFIFAVLLSISEFWMPFNKASLEKTTCMFHRDFDSMTFTKVGSSKILVYLACA